MKRTLWQFVYSAVRPRAILSGTAILMLAGAAMFGAAGVGITSRAVAPAKPAQSRPSSGVIQTDKAAYLAGETVNIIGSGFAPFETVSLRVTHANGTAEANMGHDAIYANADSNGAFEASWVLSSFDDAGVGFVVEAVASSVSGSRAAFSRSGILNTDRPSYEPGDIALITARGFDPGELVTIEVKDGSDHPPIIEKADKNGEVTARVQLASSTLAAGFITVQATAPESGLVSSASVPFSFFAVTDQQGANDKGVQDQSDLTQMGRDNSLSAYYQLFWSWDSTNQWTGSGNTGDACALFSDRADGNVTSVICGQISNPGGNASIVAQTAGSPFVFTCNGSRTDRCGGPVAKPYTPGVEVFASPLNMGVTPVPANNLITATDPFAAGSNNPNDASLYVKILKTFLPNSVLVNVCSYPSAGSGGNNNPFDCIVSPGGGLLVIKKVAPGSTSADSFSFTVSPVPTGQASSFVLPTPVVGAMETSPIGLAIGTGETVTEGASTAWSLTGAVCRLEGPNGVPDTGPVTGTFSAANRNVTGIAIESGKTTTCTFTNIGIKPSLKIIKRIVNNHGGAKVVGDFGITTTAGSLNWGAGVTVGTTTTYTATTLTDLSVGSKSLHENDVAGYTEGTWSCVGAAGAVNGHAQNGSVVLGNGENVTCTITNDDDPASLKIVKRIKNDHSGTKVVGDFGITTSAGTLSFGTGVTVGDITTYTATTLINLAPGSKTLHENDVAGYTEGTWSCVGAAGAVNDDAQTGSVFLANGENVTCTITNDDDPASLTIVKRIKNDNGGTKVVSDFGITTSAGTLSFGTGATVGDITTYTATTLTDLTRGSKTLHENVVAGYTEGSWSCVGAAGAVNGNAQTGSVVLGNGENVTCTITNDDIKATVSLSTVQAWTINDTATLTGLREGGTSTVTFKLFGPTNTACADTGAVDTANSFIYSFEATLNASQSGTVSVNTTGPGTTTGSNVVTKEGIYRWRVSFSGNAFNESSAGTCGQETTTISSTPAQP